jgi:hypothetical protein
MFEVVLKYRASGRAYLSSQISREVSDASARLEGRLALRLLRVRLSTEYPPISVDDWMISARIFYLEEVIHECNHRSMSLLI